MSFRKILFVPSADSLDQPAARRVLQLSGTGTEVEVFEPVFDPHLDLDLVTGPGEFERLRDELVVARLAKAQSLAAAMREKNVRVSAAAAWDHPLYEAVIRRVLAIDADLVVTEPLAGRAGASSNNDWRLIAECPAPVLIVSSDGSRPYENIVAAVDPFHAHAKPADLDMTILDKATDAARSSGATLTAVHCFVPLSKVLDGSAFEHLPVDDAESQLERSRQRSLDELAATAGLADGRAWLLRGRPADTLTELAEKGAADLIVMGALSRGRLRDLVIGSTAERVLAAAVGDIMIVKPRSFETRVKPGTRDALPAAPIYYPL